MSAGKPTKNSKLKQPRGGLTMGQALMLAMKEFITPERKKEISILDFVPFDWGESIESVREDVGKILYSLEDFSTNLH